MIFGVREIRTELGSYSSEQCEACNEGDLFRLAQMTRWLVVFGINLIPVSKRFESTCDGCENVRSIDYQTGRKTAILEFGPKHKAMQMAIILKLTTLALVVAAAIVLPTTLVKPAPLGPQALKNLVTENGLYSIQDAEGHVMGIVEQADGIKTLTFYEKTSRLVGEPGADGSFIRREYYQESAVANDLTEDGISLARISSSPGVLEDRYGTMVRVYHYDAASKTVGYAKGISDLSTIRYQSDRVDYPFTYYSDDGETKEVAVVLYLQPESRIEASFVPTPSGVDQIAVLNIKKFDGRRISEETTYSMSSSLIDLAIQAGLSRASTVADLMAFIEQNSLTPANRLTYHYFGDTKVYTSIDLEMPDGAGAMQRVTQSYNVYKKGGFYLQNIPEQ